MEDIDHLIVEYEKLVLDMKKTNLELQIDTLRSQPNDLALKGLFLREMRTAQNEGYRQLIEKIFVDKGYNFERYKALI